MTENVLFSFDQLFSKSHIENLNREKQFGVDYPMTKNNKDSYKSCDSILSKFSLFALCSHVICYEIRDMFTDYGGHRKGTRQ